MLDIVYSLFQAENRNSALKMCEIFGDLRIKS